MIIERLKASAVLLIVSWGCRHDQDGTDGAISDVLGGASATEDSGGTQSGGGTGFAGAGGNKDYPTGGRGGEDTGGVDNGGEGGGEEFGGCGLLQRALCDDGNPCTEDICEESGCRHEPVEDGVSCEDSNACTANDTCLQGKCEGNGTISQGQLGGQLRSFGSSPSFDRMDIEFTRAGLSVVLSDELMVFTEPGRIGYLDLVLVAFIDGQLLEVDRLSSEHYIDSFSSIVWPRHRSTFLVRLGDDRFALVDESNGLAVYDATGSQLTQANQLSLAGDGVRTLYDAEAHGGSLWLLDSADIHRYDIAADGSPHHLATLHVPNYSTAFAASDDGNLLYVGGQQGVFRIDTTDLSHPVVDDAPLIAEPNDSQPRQMSLHGDLLFIQSEELWGSSGSARLYGGSNLELIKTFPSALEVSFPLGATFTDDGLLLQRLLYEDHKPDELRAELYTIDGQDPMLVDSFTYADLGALEQPGESMDNLLFFPPVSQRSLAVLGHRVVDTEGGTIRELNGPLQGSFATVRAVGDNQLLAFGSESSHLLDLDEEGPSLVHGGLFPPSTSGLYNLVFHESSVGPRPPLLVGPDGPHVSIGKFAWLEATAGQAAQPGGFFGLPGAPLNGYASQFAAGPWLFRQQLVPQQSLTLQAFALPHQTDGLESIESLRPIDVADIDDLRNQFLAVDREGTSFLIVHDHSDSAQTVFDWYEMGSDDVELVATFNLDAIDAQVNDLTMTNDRVVFVTLDQKSIMLLQRNGDHVELVATRDLTIENGTTIEFRNLLGSEGERVYVTGLFDSLDDPGRLEMGLDVLSLHDLTTIAHYSTPQEMSSMTVSGETLVFGGPSVLLTASPACTGG